MNNNFNRNDLELKTKAVADLSMSYQWKLWFWGDSIGLEGLLDASWITQDERYFSFVYGILKAWASRKEKRNEWEYTAAGVALMRVYAKTHDPELLRLAIDFADYLIPFRKSDRGITIRYETAIFDLPPEVPEDHPDAKLTEVKKNQIKEGGPCAFVDTMHFDAPFFSALFHATGDEKYARLAIETIHPQIELLKDPKTGLFDHFWIERSRKTNGILWGRGNGWAMLGMLHVLLYLENSNQDLHFIKQTVIEQMKVLATLQDESGHWHTILNDKSSYLETSIASFVIDGFSIAIKKGWLDQSYRSVVDKALEASLKEIQSDGLVKGVSFETYPSTVPEHYRTMPRGAMVPWGQGPFLTAIASYLKMIDKER